jgi:dihydrofolate reductase
LGKLIYSMGVSLDGFISGPAGELDWSAPDEDLHRFHNQEMREVGVHLCGRRLYETMVYWETADEDPTAADYILEFAGLWKALPKVVFSATLETVEGNATLERRRGAVAETVDRLKRVSGAKDIAVGGAGLAGTCMKLGLLDECRVFVSPVILGAGTPFFAAVERPIALDLVETRTFGSRVVYLRYARADGVSSRT